MLHDPTEAQEDLTDLVGYDLYDWLSHGVAGYDEAMGTFFFNLEGSWIFGIEGEEIPTIGMLQAILPSNAGREYIAASERTYMGLPELDTPHLVMWNCHFV